MKRPIAQTDDEIAAANDAYVEAVDDGSLARDVEAEALARGLSTAEWEAKYGEQAMEAALAVLGD
jgi:hypothetical protein